MSETLRCSNCSCELEKVRHELFGLFYKCPLCGATKRYKPQIKPMTLIEIRRAFEDSLVEGVALMVQMRTHDRLVWAIIDYRYGEVEAVWNANAYENLLEKDYGKTWRCWERKPTREEMEAEWEK